MKRIGLLMVCAGVLASALVGVPYLVEYFNLVRCRGNPESLCTTISLVSQSDFIIVLSIGIFVTALGLILTFWGNRKPISITQGATIRQSDKTINQERP